jgi:hypothetical protein
MPLVTNAWVCFGELNLKSEFPNPKCETITKNQGQRFKTMHRVWELIPLRFLALPGYQIPELWSSGLNWYLSRANNYQSCPPKG